MGFAYWFLRCVALACLVAGLLVSVHHGSAGFAGIFGMLLGTALERLTVAMDAKASELQAER